MKIYLVERTDKWSYDDYDKFVCFANSEEEAKNLSPDDYYVWMEGKWYFKYSDGTLRESSGCAWTDPSNVKVYELSRDPADGKATVILASYNAG